MLGIVTGFLNGLFGAGGGMALIPLLKMQKLEDKESHATCVAVILVLSLFSIYTYYTQNSLDFSLVLPYLPFGVAGALFGSMLMKKLSSKVLRKTFAVLMLFLGVRLLLR